MQIRGDRYVTFEEFGCWRYTGAGCAQARQGARLWTYTKFMSEMDTINTEGIEKAD